LKRVTRERRWGERDRGEVSNFSCLVEQRVWREILILWAFATFSFLH